MQPDERSAPSVALVAAGELFGGVERLVVDLSAGLERAGVRVGVALFHDGELARRLRAQAVVPVILPSRRSSTLAGARALASWLRRESFRVVHVHGYKAAVAAALARLRTDFDTVATVHGLAEPTSGRALAHLKSRAYAGSEEVALRALHASVCYVSRDLQQRFRASHARLATCIVANGIEGFGLGRPSRPREIERCGFHLALVGRLDPVKGHRFAIEALADPAASDAVHLHVLGDGPCETQLREFASAHQVEGRVHFHGFRRDVHAFVAHCDALLMPSLHEGLPYTLLEAMALGVPVIASAVGGLAETLQHEESALLVPPGDVSRLAHAIARLRAQPAFAASLAARASELQAREYSLERMTRAYLGVYRAATSG